MEIILKKLVKKFFPCIVNRDYIIATKDYEA